MTGYEKTGNRTARHKHTPHSCIKQSHRSTLQGHGAQGGPSTAPHEGDWAGPDHGRQN